MKLSALVSAMLPLVGVWLGSFLTKEQVKNQFLMETRKTVYAKLLSSVVAEENYPPEIAGTAGFHSEEKVEKYDEKIAEWRKNRKIIKGLVAEALLVSESEVLRDKLSIFLSSDNPNARLEGLEELMRNEIGF